MSKFEVGDLVRLTGYSWADTIPQFDVTGSFRVEGFKDHIHRGDGVGVAAYFFDEEGEEWYLDESSTSEWAAEVEKRDE